MTGNFMVMMLQSLAALAAVLALFAGLVWLVRRLQASRFQSQEGHIKIVQRLALDTRHSLIEVACGEHRHLIGLSPDGITPIASEITASRSIEQAKDHAAPPVGN